VSALSDGGDVQKKEVVSCGNVKECMIEEWGCGSERGHAADAIPDFSLYLPHTHHLPHLTTDDTCAISLILIAGGPLIDGAVSTKDTE